jgi:hypothetical protein
LGTDYAIGRDILTLTSRPPIAFLLAGMSFSGDRIALGQFDFDNLDGPLYLRVRESEMPHS